MLLRDAVTKPSDIHTEVATKEVINITFDIELPPVDTPHERVISHDSTATNSKDFTTDAAEASIYTTYKETADGAHTFADSKDPRHPGGTPENTVTKIESASSP